VWHRANTTSKTWEIFSILVDENVSQSASLTKFATNAVNEKTLTPDYASKTKSPSSKAVEGRHVRDRIRDRKKY
jgi:hypothetical protein